MSEICLTINQCRMGMVESGLGVDETRFAPNFWMYFYISIIKTKKKFKNDILGNKTAYA